MTSAWTAGCFNSFCLFQTHRLPNISLPDSGDDEVNLLARQRNTTTAPVQTIPFTGLPAELRNRIYEYTLPSHQDQLIIATPFRDEFMSYGDQPAITKVSKQLRSETLEMFYTNSTLVAYIQNFDFRSLIRWVDCITSNESVSKVTVEVKLLDRIKCAYELLDLVRFWKDIKHQNVHLRIHNCYTDGSRRVFRVGGFDQRDLVAKAVKVAEQLQQEGDTTEEKLLSVYHEQFEDVDRRKLCSFAKGPNESCMIEGVGNRHLSGL